MDVAEMQKTVDNMHKELLEMISSISDGTNSDKASSVRTLSFGFDWHSILFAN